jgi:hypothetical protein
MSLEQIRDLYENKGSLIFSDSLLDNLADLGNIEGAQYSNVDLEKELERFFGDTTLAQLKKRVLITSFDLDNESSDETQRRWKPKIFHNLPGKDSDGIQLARKVGMYTTAAPTYFPSVDGYIDGGVFANNPSMCALTQTQDTRVRKRPALTDIVLLSVGTGLSLIHIPGQQLDWGLAQWAKPILTLILDGASGIADYQCARLLNKRYHRLAPVFPPGVVLDLDAIKQVPDMVQFAKQVDLANTAKWLAKYWMK